MLAPVTTKFLLHMEGNLVDSVGFLQNAGYNMETFGLSKSGFGEGMTGSAGWYADFTPNQVFSYECVFNNDNLDFIGAASLLLLNGSNGNYMNLMVESSGSVYFDVVNDMQGFFLDTTIQPNSGYHHFAVSRDVNNNVYLYVDGVLKNTTYNDVPLGVYNTLEIGLTDMGGGTPLIDELLYNDGDSGVYDGSPTYTVPTEPYTLPPTILSSISEQEIAVNTVQSIELYPNAVANIATVIASPYFRYPANWSRVELWMDSPTNFQGSKILKFYKANNYIESKLLFSARAELDTWTCSKIMIYNNEGQYLEITGSDIPSTTWMTAIA